MADKTSLEHDIKKAIQLLQEDKMEKAGHHLKHIGIKAYYSSKDSKLEQDWLDLHKKMNLLGHVFLKKDAASQAHLEKHRQQALNMLESMLDGNAELNQEMYKYSKNDHIAFLKDKAEFLEEELEKSQRQVLQLRKEKREAEQ